MSARSNAHWPSSSRTTTPRGTIRAKETSYSSLPQPCQCGVEQFIVAIVSEACFDTTAEAREYFDRTKNGAEFEGGWTAPKFAAFTKWIDAHPEKLKMTRAQFDELVKQALTPLVPGAKGGRRD